MWLNRIRLTVLSILWSACLSERTLFDAGLISYINNFDDRGPSHVHFLYPTLSDDSYQSSSSTKVNLEYLFSEISTSGYDLTVRAILNAPTAPGRYPIVAYLFGDGGFSLDSHPLLSHLAGMGFIVVVSDMPDYRVGNKVLASAVQSHMGAVIKEMYQSCPPDAQGLCEAMDFDHIAVIGPGVVDSTCTLDGWTRRGLHPKAQVVLEGKVEVDVDCHPVEFDTQDVALVAFGKKDQDTTYADAVKKLVDWTQQDSGMKAYFLGLTKIPSVMAFTDLCAIAHEIRPVRHLSATKSCGDIDEDDLNDAQTIARVVISNILFHHFWDHPLSSPVDKFDPKEYTTYLYREIVQGLIKDAVGKLSQNPSGKPHLADHPVSGYHHFRTPTVLTIIPLILVGVLYFTCGIGLCMNDCRNTNSQKATPGICFDGLISKSFKSVFSRKTPRQDQESFKYSSDEIAEYERRTRSPSTTPETMVDHSTSSPRTVVTHSSCDFLTGEKRSPSPWETPRSRRTVSRNSSVELTVSVKRAVQSKENQHTQPLLESNVRKIEQIVKNPGGFNPPKKPKRKTQKCEQKVSSKEIYEALGSGTDSDGEEIKPITNSELNKLLS